MIFCSLGALHDGYDNGCDIAGDYIMSASLGLTNNVTRGQPWFFSSCSVDEIDAFITVLNRWVELIQSFPFFWEWYLIDIYTSCLIIYWI